MFGFIKIMLIKLLSFGGSLAFDRIKCVSLNIWPCQARVTIDNLNSNAPLYYPFTVSVNECGGSCITMAIHMFDDVFEIK